MALQEALKMFPVAAVWDELLRRTEMPPDEGWLADIKRYESEALMQRVGGNG